ncbi:hypothetical protein BHM03_00062734 [Ensete ventricosum]|uniref:Uncharacterized protein n=1 Tax=Ensete ventricosum TaxID=4639 RepID=A0A445MMW1_ENSVE|nr:hypothetical protein BHM03_00062734 [Ensete ventricosum]
MTSSDSSSSVRVVSHPGSGETSRCDPKVGSSGASSEPPSPVDARVLRDLEVMKSDHDLDTTVTEGSLAVIRERYNIPVEYGLHVPQPEQRPYSLDGPGMCISVDALEASLWFPLHPLIEECLSRGGYYLTTRVGFRVSGAPSNNKSWKSRYLYVSGPAWGFRLDWSAHPIGNVSPYLSEEETVLVGRLKGILSYSRAIKEMAELWLVASGKVPSTRPIAQEVGASPAREAPKASLKRSVVSPTEQAEDAVRHHKKVKVLTRRHKSRPGEGESRSRSKAKEFERGLLHPQLARELYTLPSEVLMAQAAKEMVLLDALKSKGVPEAVAEAEEHASELREEPEKTKRERGEELLRREASEKELYEAVKDLESARAELPRQSVVQYKESLGFKEGLKKMGRVTYEYEYRVALARFCAQHPDAEFEEDTFTIHREDNLVPMERQQAFDDLVPPEP